MENKQFFDPYNFNNQFTNQAMPQMPMESDMNFMQGPASMNPIVFYEQQYWYYKYLCKMLEYKAKSKELDRQNKENK